MPVTAVIPLKALATAKGRLAAALGEPERRRLVESMAAHVIGVCLDCPQIDDVLVVAGDNEAAAVARRCGAQVIVVYQPGLDVALRAADDRLQTQDATLVVVADLPQVTVADLSAVIAAAASSGPTVVIAPTFDGGTGALLRRPPDVIAPAYGPGSAARHTRRATEAGLSPRVIRRDGLALDVDTPEQLKSALASAADNDVR